MTSKKIKNNKGFTLIEAMFAVFILTLATTSFMSIVASSLFSARYARDEITANYLLQEVIDYVRNDRDTNVLLQNTYTSGIAWNNFIQKYSSKNCFNTGCYIDVFNTTSPYSTITSGCSDLVNDNDANCPYLYYDDNASEQFYTYDTTINGSIKTNFRRQLLLTLVNTDEVRVKVTVMWKNGNLSKKRSLETSLMKWQ